MLLHNEITTWKLSVTVAVDVFQLSSGQKLWKFWYNVKAVSEHT